MQRRSTDTGSEPLLPGTTSKVELPPTNLIRPRFWLSISWRFTCVCLLSGLISITLRAFQNMGSLSTPEKRGFNTLIILFSALMSVTLGSLLGFLGGMLRWRLLARREYTPLDVDLLLGMQNPTGSLKLIWDHVWGKRSSRTTLAVAVYFLVNMVGRLGISALGLAYSLNEIPGIAYPVQVTNWSSTQWFENLNTAIVDSFDSSGKFPDEDDLDALSRAQVGRWIDLATAGLAVLNDGFNFSNVATYNMSDIGSTGLNREISQDGTVSYSYHFHEFQGHERRPLGDNVLHSASKCTGRVIRGEAVYEGGYGAGAMGHVVANLSGVPQGSDEPISAELPLLTRVSAAICGDIIGSRLEKGAFNVAWISLSLAGSKIPDPPACATTFLFTNPTATILGYVPELELLFGECMGVLYECSTCLGEGADKLGTGAPQLFPGLPAGMSPFYSRQLARFPTFGLPVFQEVESGLGSDPFLETMYFRTYDFEEGATDMMRGFHLDIDSETTDVSDMYYITKQSEIMAAEIAARPPVLAILEAQQQVPRMAKHEGDSELPFITVELEVKWERVWGILLGILVGLALAVGLTLFWCRQVVMRDQSSFLSIAMLLKKPLEATGARTVDLGPELARQMKYEGIMMRYGAQRKEKKDEVYELALWHGSGGKFYDGKYQ